MKFDNEITGYLSGGKFSASLAVNFSPEKFLVQTRVNKIVDIVQGKKVVHLGCADHLDLIEYKIGKGKWLHGQLLEHTDKCLGIDINPESIAYLKEKLRIENVYCLDIEKDNALDEILGEEMWDCLLLGEIIEHVNNPVAFLENIHAKFHGKVKNIIITAPNILNTFCAKMTRKNIEYINSDHRYWFSPFTLTKVMMESGFKDCNLEYVEHTVLPFYLEVYKYLHQRMKKPLYFRASRFSTILVVADF